MSVDTGELLELITLVETAFTAGWDAAKRQKLLLQ